MKDIKDLLEMKTKTIYYMSVFLALIGILSCKSMAKTVAEIQQTGELILKDVAYGTDQLQKMDIALVAGRTRETPLVILIHGGGWMSGDKEDTDFMKDAFFTNGINVVSINYRWETGSHDEEMMEDIDHAVSYIHTHADEWEIRTSGFVFWGGSAGGHLSLLYAYNYDEENLISLVITLGAPTKLDDLEGAKQSDIEGLLPIVTGKPWNSDTNLLDIAYKKASPYYGEELKPSFLVHGEKDNIVPKRQSILMSKRLKQQNIPDTLVILPNSKHGGENTPKEVIEKLNQAICNWVIKYSE